MKKLKAAWIGFRQPEADPFQVYEAYAKIGYKGMDGDLSRMEGDPAENLKRIRAMGLTILCTSVGRGASMKEMAKDTEFIKQTVERAKFYGVNKVNIPMSSVISSFGLGYGNNGTYDSVMEDIEGMNALVKALGDEGLIPMYHNHYQEFTVCYKGVSVMDYFLTQIDPRLMLKCDVGWVYVGGMDPVAFMEKAKDRIALLHIKDFTEMIQPRYLVNADKETDFGFTAVGTGKLDLKAILAKAIEIGQEWAIVEQDRRRVLDWEDALRVSYLNMKETGYVE
jgi:sugar phosphate isomerase/epimerase